MDMKGEIILKKCIKSIGYFINRYNNHAIIIDPKDNFDELSRKYFIQSLLVGSSTGIIRITDNGFGKIKIDDGAKRVNAIVDFVSGKFPLDDFVLRDIGVETNMPMYYSELFGNRVFEDKFLNYLCFVEVY